MALLVVNGITKRFEGLVAVSDLSFTSLMKAKWLALLALMVQEKPLFST